MSGQIKSGQVSCYETTTEEDLLKQFHPMAQRKNTTTNIKTYRLNQQLKHFSVIVWEEPIKQTLDV